MQSAPTYPANVESGGAVRKRRALERERRGCPMGCTEGRLPHGGRWSAAHSSQRRGGTGCPRESEQHGHGPRMAGRCGAAEHGKEAGRGDQDGAESEEAGGKRRWAGGWWPRACSLTMTVTVLQAGGGLGKVGLGRQHHVFVLQPLTWAVVSVAIGSD